MSFKAVREVVALDRSVRGAERLVLIALAVHANDQLECWPSVSTIAHEAGISERHAFRMLASLIDRGLLEVRHGGGRRRSNLYRIRLDAALGRGPNPDKGVRENVDGNPDRASQNPDNGDRNPDSSATETLTPMSPESPVKGNKKRHERQSGDSSNHLDGLRAELGRIELFLQSAIVRPAKRKELEGRKRECIRQLESAGVGAP